MCGVLGLFAVCGSEVFGIEHDSALFFDVFFCNIVIGSRERVADLD